MKKLTLFTFVIVLVGCTDSNNTIKTLESAGYDNIETRGYDLLVCSEDDFFRTRFIADNPRGRRVEGTVCSGLFKNSTIRF